MLINGNFSIHQLFVCFHLVPFMLLGIFFDLLAKKNLRHLGKMWFKGRTFITWFTVHASCFYYTIICHILFAQRDLCHAGITEDGFFNKFSRFLVFFTEFKVNHSWKHNFAHRQSCICHHCNPAPPNPLKWLNFLEILFNYVPNIKFAIWCEQPKSITESCKPSLMISVRCNLDQYIYVITY